MTVPFLWIAAVVRPHHANTFVEEWIRHSRETGALRDAFSETHLVQWPDNDGRCGDEETPEERRYNEIQDEILERVLDVLEPAIAEAFIQAASEMLARERRRQANVQK